MRNVRILLKGKHTNYYSIIKFSIDLHVVFYLQLFKSRKPHGNNIPAVHTAIIREKKISTEQLLSFKDLLSNIDNVEVCLLHCITSLAGASHQLELL